MLNYTISKIHGKSEPIPRHQLRSIQEYLKSDYTSRVCLLQGLRRTGKTTLLEQSINWLIESKQCEASDILYIAAEQGGDDMMKGLYKALSTTTCDYIFIDEITTFVDFLQKCSELYNYTRVYNKHIVITGSNLPMLYLAQMDALYDKVVKIDVTPLSFYEQCLFFNGDAPVTPEIYTQYEETGGFFSGMDLPKYLQVSLAHCIVDTLRRDKGMSNGDWISEDSICRKYTSSEWMKIIDSISICGVGGHSNLVDLKYKLESDHELVFNSIGVTPEFYSVARSYAEHPVIYTGSPVAEAVSVIFRFLQSCGYIHLLNNVSYASSSSKTLNCYLGIPCIARMYGVRLVRVLGIQTGFSVVEWLTAGCGISNYNLAHPNANLHYWDEMVPDTGKYVKCELVVTDTNNFIPVSNSGEAIEFSPSNQSKVSGVHFFKDMHPELRIRSCIKVERHEMASWVYRLGSTLYATGAPVQNLSGKQETTAFK